MATERTIRIFAVGDIMLGDSSHFLGRGVASHVHRHGPSYPLSSVRSRLDEADLFFANLESPLSRTPGNNSWERVYRGVAAAAPTLRLGRRTILSLANNHIFEHGAPVLAETADLIAGAGIDHAGLDGSGGLGQAEASLTIDGLTVQVLAASLIRDITRRPVPVEEIEAWLVDRLQRGGSDLRIVSLHWGDEYVHTPSPRQRRLARMLADAKAHLVIGHHPHVLQPVERIGGTLVAYSLGNFLFDHDWTDGTRTGGILKVAFRGGCIGEWSFEATTCGRDCRPRVAEPRIAAWAQSIISSPCEAMEDHYAVELASARRRMRVRMKAELIRHFFHVGTDTWRFLLTKRRRPRPPVLTSGAPRA